MENLKETGVSHLVNAEGVPLAEFEAQKRQELLTHIKEKRSQRDTLLKESSSVKNKILGFFGKGDKAAFEMEAKQLQNETLASFKYTKLPEMRRSIKNETEEVIDATVVTPLKEIKAGYVLRETADRQVEGVDSVDARLREERGKSDFNIENLKVLLKSPSLREDAINALADFFNEDSRAALDRDVQHTFEEPYSYEGASGFPVELARAINESIHAAIEAEGVLNIKDNPKLFSVLNSTVLYCPDSLTLEARGSITDLVINRGTGLTMSAFSEMRNLIDMVERGDKKETLNEVLEEKFNVLFEKKQWDEIHSAYRSHARGLSDMARVRLSSYLDTVGLDFSKIEGAWNLKGSVGFSRWDNLGRNMENIEAVEALHPGASRVLLEEFGIKEFRRYPTGLLVKQYLEKDNHGPYGVLLYSNDDHNNAFDTNADIIAKLGGQLDEGGVMLRIGEFDSKYELMKRLAVFNDRYGDEDKISFLVLGAHGSEEGFSTRFMQDVNKETLEGEGVKKIKGYFVEQPNIVLASCSTGAENGFGQSVSKLYEARVLAPKQPTFVKDIGVSFDAENKAQFSVEYGNSDVLRTYSKGM